MKRLSLERLTCSVLLALCCSTLHAVPPSKVANEILSEQTSEEQRSALIASSLDNAADVLREMTRDLEVGTPEEYRRIPSIWKVAVAAGKANDVEQLRGLLDLSLPKGEEPLRDWQAVVIGGGIINGLSLENVWPEERMAEITKGDAALMARWMRSLALASTMADDEKVPHGTRYDALRMVALRPWAECRDQLVKYLSKEVHPELQQGAVSGLSDARSPEVAAILIHHLPNLTQGNRDLAVRALLRDEKRSSALRDAVEKGKVIELPSEARQQLR